MRISWVSEAGIMENIAAIIKEYKDTRNLHVSQARTWVGMIAGTCYDQSSGIFKEVNIWYLYW